MRVCLLSPVGVVGGAERVLLAWAAAARDAVPAHLSAVLLADGPLRERLSDLGVVVEVVPLPAALAASGDTALKAGRGVRSLDRLDRLVPAAPAAVQFLGRLRFTLHDLRPDLVHSNGLKTHLLAAVAAPRRTPVIWHLHDFYSERPVAKWALKLARRGAAAGVAISDAVRRDATVLIPGLPIATVRNTIDTDHFSPGSADPRLLDDLAGLVPTPAGTVRVGLVATYANWKGHAVFLDALARLPPTMPVRGYIVGGPIYATAGSQVSRESLEHRVASHGLVGRVGFLPFQSDPANVYRALDVVVHASTRPEPFGLTIAEAMSCGRAVIVAAAGGATELFTQDVDAVGHQPGDVEGLANAIRRLVVSRPDRERLGSAARQAAFRRFSQHRLPSEVASVYSTILRSRRPLTV